jgi:mercuric ion transport protein
MHIEAMTIKKDHRQTPLRRGQTLTAAGGLLGAFAASSCCILPLVLFGLGVSGAWIENFTRLAPFQPYFVAATIVFLGAGYGLVYRSSKFACADGETCARPLPTRLVRAGLILATLLVAAALGFDFLAPLFLNS